MKISVREQKPTRADSSRLNTRIKKGNTFLLGIFAPPLLLRAAMIYHFFSVFGVVCCDAELVVGSHRFSAFNLTQVCLLSHNITRWSLPGPGVTKDL